MTSNDSNLTPLYAELSRFIRSGDLEKALKAANRILHTAPDEEKAFQCKIVCFIQLGKFSDALQTIKNKPNLSKSLIFETAYCQYRLNNSEDAYQTIQSASELDFRTSELKAQILYRLEKYRECYDTYRTIIKNTQDEYEDERETNSSAVVSNIVFEEKVDDFPELREDTYELCYNSACRMIASCNYSSAEKKLRTAEKMCRESMSEDGCTEEEIEAELGIIKVQLAYCYQKQSREKEAQALYVSILKNKPDDVALLAIASNNSVAINRDRSYFDSRKKMKIANSDSVEHKLTTHLRKQIAINNCLFQVISNQPCTASCDNLLKRYPDTEYLVVLIRAVEMTKEGKVTEAVKKMQDFAATNTMYSLYMGLSAAQILLSHGLKTEAAEILSNLGNDSFRLGIVSTLVTLYNGQSDQAAACNLLQKCVEWYRKNKADDPGLVDMYREAAEFHIRSGHPEKATASLEKLLHSEPTNKKIMAQLVMAYAQTDRDKALKVSKNLPPLASFSEVDVDELESSNWIMGLKSNVKSRTVISLDSVSPRTPKSDTKPSKPKRKRKGKLPKNYEEGATPDPERWLPKYERTGFRRKRDRRAKDIIKGSQGMTSTSSSDLYDYAKGTSLGSGSSTSLSSSKTSLKGKTSDPNMLKLQGKQKKKKGSRH